MANKIDNKESYVESGIGTKTTLIALICLIMGVVAYLIGHELEPNLIYSGTIIKVPDANDTVRLEQDPTNGHGLSMLFYHIAVILATAAIVDLIYKVSYKKDFNEKVESILSRYVPSFDSYYRHRVLGIYDELPSIRELIANSKKEIVIIQTYIPGLDNYYQDFIRAFAHNSNLKLKLYLLNPESPITVFRSEGITPLNAAAGEIDKDLVKEKIKTNRDTIKTLFNEIKTRHHCNADNLIAMQYDLMPLFSMYKFDDEVYIGFYRYGYEAIHSTQVKLDFTAGIGLQQFQEHLDYLDAHPSTKPFITHGKHVSETINTNGSIIH
ncbi:hypothetical protein [Chitinophaga pinensis]|uniref:Uncharacterized protein n=1 Tax=Chitinophaga pinensis (strain ATCC 43595 / DSM 2588 / LMG 13176 / NBRC 15968 / NCIMB 11800 / UQM 2034) TaxID=485918 RepID=A0A979GYX5_CHIPD|nr:hypothetical protein [Chitinophaga pinensis]ACU63486.1 hypothetical protein Cpin_6074 [Chitinophaga pinensis DSM 2588]